VRQAQAHPTHDPGVMVRTERIEVFSMPWAMDWGGSVRPRE
jgi:hypothetical protein